jgi:hypothetical protein
VIAARSADPIDVTVARRAKIDSYLKWGSEGKSQRKNPNRSMSLMGQEQTRRLASAIAPKADIANAGTINRLARRIPDIAFLIRATCYLSF